MASFFLRDSNVNNKCLGFILTLSWLSFLSQNFDHLEKLSRFLDDKFKRLLMKTSDVETGSLHRFY